MTACLARRAAARLGLTVVFAVAAAAAYPQTGSASADARLRALYTEEWN